MSDTTPTDSPVPPSPPPEPGATPGSGSVATRVVAAALLLAALGGLAAWSLSSGTDPQAEQQAGAHGPTPVEVVVVATEDVDLAPRFLGQTAASQVVDVRSMISGYLVDRSFDEGAVVEAGQRLFQIDPRPIELEIQEAQARLAGAEARRDRAGQQLARFEALQDQNAATRGEVEEWEKEQRVAAAEVELQRAQIAAAQLRLDYASIEAPLAGTIGEAAIDVGTFVSGSAESLATIQQLDPIEVRYALTERDLLRLAGPLGGASQPRLESLELSLTLGDGSEHPFHGTIDFVQTELSASTGTATARARVPNPGGRLRPGQFVHVTLLGLQRLGVIRVPQAAVMHAPTGATVYVVADDDTVAVRSVELGGWLGEGKWEITRGLEPGDQVICNRLLTLRPGAAVAPTVIGLEQAAGTEPAEPELAASDAPAAGSEESPR